MVGCWAYGEALRGRRRVTAEMAAIMEFWGGHGAPDLPVLQKVSRLSCPGQVRATNHSAVPTAAAFNARQEWPARAGDERFEFLNESGTTLSPPHL